MKNDEATNAVQVPVPVIAEMEIGTITDLEAAFLKVVSEHKDAVASIHESMVEADSVYGKYLSPDYIPIEDTAKKDRAVLNKCEKNIAEQYATLKEAYEKPLQNIEANIRQIRNAIKDASGIVDKAVKDYEELQKSKKKKEIEDYFATKKFGLVPLEKIFNQKWLNKGTKIKNVKAEIDEAIAKIYQDIEVLERIPDFGVAVKAFYLQSLDMGAALRQADTLKDNAKLLAQEQAGREERKIQEQCEANNKAERNEKVEAFKAERSQELIDQAFDLHEGTTTAQAKSEIIEFTATFRGTKEDLLGLRMYMTAHNIAYQKGLVLNSPDDARLVAKSKNIAVDIKTFIYVPNVA